MKEEANAKEILSEDGHRTGKKWSNCEKLRSIRREQAGVHGSGAAFAKK